MSLECNNRHPKVRSVHRTCAWAIGAGLLIFVLGACAGSGGEAATPEEEAGATQPLAEQATTAVEEPILEPTLDARPTPVYDYFKNVSSLKGTPQDTPEGTFELYLRDAIAQQVALQREKVDMRVHYQNPEIMARDMGALITDIKLIEDRSKLTRLSDTKVLYDVDIDVQVVFADQKMQLRHCTWPVNLEEVRGMWYVVNPTELAIFANCAF